MITVFQIMDATGKAIGEGEIDGEVYRVFTNGTNYQEYNDLDAMFAACGGVAIQPKMFQSEARTRQYRLMND